MNYIKFSRIRAISSLIHGLVTGITLGVLIQMITGVEFPISATWFVAIYFVYTLFYQLFVTAAQQVTIEPRIYNTPEQLLIRLNEVEKISNHVLKNRIDNVNKFMGYTWTNITEIKRILEESNLIEKTLTAIKNISILFPLTNSHYEVITEYGMDDTIFIKSTDVVIIGSFTILVLEKGDPVRITYKRSIDSTGWEEDSKEMIDPSTMVGNYEL